MCLYVFSAVTNYKTVNTFSGVSTELTNLIIIRNSSSVEAQGSPTPERNKFSHIQFQMIKYEDLKWVSVTLTVPGLLVKYPLAY